MKRYKIRVESPEHSEEIQKFLFSLGYEWPFFGQEVVATSCNFLTFTFTFSRDCREMYIYEDYFNDLEDYTEVELVTTVHTTRKFIKK